MIRSLAVGALFVLFCTLTFGQSSSVNNFQSLNLPNGTTSITSSRNPIVPGIPLTLTATVFGATPAGTVNFQDGAVNIAGCSAQPVSSGTATCLTSGLAVGRHNISGTYSGDGTNPTAVSDIFVQRVISAFPAWLVPLLLDSTESLVPSGVTASPANNQMTVAWNAVSGAISYNVYWGSMAGVTPANGSKISDAANPLVITGLGNGTPYYAVVTAVLPNGESAASPSVSATPSIWNQAASLTRERAAHTATLLPNGKVLVAGGQWAGDELYDPATNVWTPAGTLATVRWSHTATLLKNGKVLVASGHGYGSLASPGVPSAELYDPATNAWTPAGTLALARGWHTATLLPNGKVLVTGGSDNNNSNVNASAELYDPDTNAWTSAGSMAAVRELHTATLLPNGKVLIAGGANGTPFSPRDCELYDPATNSWTVAGALNSTRADHTATLLLNGKVLVAAGEGNVGLNSAELYDPATNAWTTTGALATRRAFHTATLLSNGKVLVAAGSVLTSAEMYDPVTGLWSSGGALATGRSFHTATLLPNGEVLIVGGAGNSGYLSNVERGGPFP